MAARIPLPIDPTTPKVVAALFPKGVTNPARVLLIASPGSGKTTRVPWALLSATKGKVYVLEPRRIAAKLSAERVAEENGVTIGAEVGYQFRFERKRRDDTRLVFLTEGTLLRELASNPTLRGVDVLVLDEFHERHLQADLALALAKRLQETSRPDLRILVMSATLDPVPLEKYLPGAERIEVEAPRFPIEIEYRPRESVGTFGLEKEVRRAAENLLARPDAAAYGDLLIFLPGMAEIRRAESELRSAFGSRVDVLPLHGELTKEEQARALGAGGGKRKIILSTNIAESSVTIPGVNTVVDAGLARIASHSHASGLPRLETKPISRASAIQRAGRAGRTSAGRVMRLYAKGDFEGRAMQEIPEVLRTDLAPVLLDLTSLGVFPGFELFEAPSKERLDAGWWLLEDLGFAAADRTASAQGKTAGSTSFHPRITRCLFEIAGLLPGVHALARTEARTLALDSLIAISEGEDLGLDFLSGLKRFRISGFQTRIRDRLEEALDRVSVPTASSAAEKTNGDSVEDFVSRVILAGFHDRVGKKVERGGEAELLLARGGSAAISKDDFWAHGELFLVLDLSESKRAGDLRAKTTARSAIGIDESWLWDVEPLPIREKLERQFDERKKRWMETESFLLHDLTLSRTTREAAELAAGSKTELPLAEWERLYASWLSDLKSGLAERDSEYSPKVPGRTDAEAWVSLEVRYGLLKNGVDPAKQNDGFEAETFGDLLHSLLLANYRDLKTSRDFPDLGTLLGGLWIPAAARRFKEETPSFVSLPGRAKVPVHYEVGSPVRIESRIADFFRLTEGPKILGGKLKLSLHILAPNYRAVQITEDLRGFWERHYPTIRKEFMRKYPRHKWPENPLA
jgi:ATP-dependent helicase HrpB